MTEYSVGDQVRVVGVVREVSEDRTFPYLVNGMWWSARALRPDTGGRDLTAQDVDEAIIASVDPNGEALQNIAEYLTRIARGDVGTRADGRVPFERRQRDGYTLDSAGRVVDDEPTEEHFVDANERMGHEIARLRSELDGERESYDRLRKRYDAALAEPLHEIQCPECGATIRARMADAPEHVHKWSRHQNVTSKNYELPPYEVCECGAARSEVR